MSWRLAALVIMFAAGVASAVCIFLVYGLYAALLGGLLWIAGAFFGGVWESC